MSAKIDNPNLVPKTYQPIVSRFLNKKKNKPTITPVLVNGKLMPDFQIESEHFNLHFATQCTPVKTPSKLPKLKYKTKIQFSSFAINEDDIFLIIKIFDVNKSHGWDNVSIRIIKLCRKTIVTPLKLLFISILEERTFADD